MVQLRLDYNSVVDKTHCTCGGVLDIPQPISIDYRWEPSAIVNHMALDALTGGYRRYVEIFAVGDTATKMRVGTVMRVYGGSEIDTRSLAQHICDWHNAGLANAGA